MENLVGWIGDSRKFNNADMTVWAKFFKEHLKGCSIASGLWENEYYLRVARYDCDPKLFCDTYNSLRSILGERTLYFEIKDSNNELYAFDMDLDDRDGGMLYYGYGNYHGLWDDDMDVVKRIYGKCLRGIDKDTLHKMLTRVCGVYLKSLGVDGITGSVKSMVTDSYLRYKFICDSPDVASIISAMFYPFMEDVYAGRGTSKYVNILRKEYGSVLEKINKDNFEYVFKNCFDNYWYKSGNSYAVNMQVIYDAVVLLTIPVPTIKKELGSHWEYSLERQALHIDWKNNKEYEDDGDNRPFEESIDDWLCDYEVPCRRMDLIQQAESHLNYEYFNDTWAPILTKLGYYN